MKKRFIVTALAILLLGHTISAGLLWADYSRILEKIGRNDAILVKDQNGAVVVSKNADSKLVPASTLKVLTALAAFHYFGDDHRFYTDFFLDQESNLIVKGYGDPLFVSEVIARACEQLKPIVLSKTKKINRIIIDSSYFQQTDVPGASTLSFEPYNAPIGPTSSNFNSVNFFRDKDGTYYSAEEQTPIFPFLFNQIRQSGLSQGRILLRSTQQDLYTGSLFQFFLEKQGLTVSDTQILRENTVNRKKERIYRHVSPFTIQEVAQKLLLYSNNYIANQLVASIGAHVYGEPGNLDKGSKAVMEFTAKQFGTTDYTVVEGSGLSRDNRISAETMSLFLDGFKDYRNLMRTNSKAFYKTGTLTGVSTRVGFIESENNTIYSYVIFSNTPGKSAGKLEQMLYSDLPSEKSLR